MTTPDLLIRNGTLVTSGGRLEADILVSDGRIAAIEPRGEPRGGPREPAVETLDATGLHVLPGAIDGHVHFREPGLEHEETWLTGTRAAVMGGVTTVIDMPNTIPPTDTVERARAKLALADESSHCDFAVFGLLGQDRRSVEELAESGLVAGLKCFLGPTTGGLAAPDDDGLRHALTIARRHGVRVAFHAEDALAIERAREHVARDDAMAHLESRPAAAEVAAIDRAGRVLAETGGAGHILHISSAAGLDAVETWRERGIDLTCEATPHHLLLDLDAYERGSLAKVNPPFRGGADAAALRAALANGRIDCVASDHAPHTLADKQRAPIWEAAAGFAGVETMLPLLLTDVAAGRLTMERLVEATSERPAQIWGLWPRKGAVQLGSDADLTLVDPAREGTVRAADLHGMNNHSPFESRLTVGAPVTTIVRGRVVVRDGELIGDPGRGAAVSRA